MVIACILLGFWAVATTLMLFFRNPLPFPDRGHRTFGVPDTKAQKAVVSVLTKFGLPLRFRFKSGPLDQALLWDNTTVIHFLDPRLNHSGNGISVVVADPESAAAWATSQLEAAGYTVQRIEGTDRELPPSHVVVLTSSAFLSWAMVFRRHQLKMPQPTFVALDS